MQHVPLGVARSPTCRPARRASSCSRWREAAAQCSTSRFCWLLHTSVSARTPLHALSFHPPHCTSRRNTCKSSGGKHEAPRARRCLPPLFLPPFCRAPCAQLLSAMHLLRAAQCQHTHIVLHLVFRWRFLGDSMLITRAPIFITVEISRARQTVWAGGGSHGR